MASLRVRRYRTAQEIARGATDWLLAHDGQQGDPSLYAGDAGIALALREAHHHFGDDLYAVAAQRCVDHLTGLVDEVEDNSLYFGLAGIAFTLNALGSEEAASRALATVSSRAEGGRWGQMFELLFGNAGVGLAALHVGDLDLAVKALEPYLTTATETPHGVNWQARPTPPRSHHIAHGTLGIAYALAAVGSAVHRSEFVDLALSGAADVVSRNEAGPDGFLVPHSDPQHRPELIERYSLGWCNGPSGDAQVFRLLGQITGDPQWPDWANRCWITVTQSGLPNRIRPGFWDNNGRCCGTAGVLALACDRVVEREDSLDFADVLVDDLIARAIVDDRGARWSNLEHRAADPNLPPLPGWAMGNAGILRELLRYVRICEGHPEAYAVQWPDQPHTAP